ncbi:hypothetical protein ASPFODRAFT_38029 [Aspergillus luchuensis CBS 106.47]|uniref:Uncharacterized protein n=1 Tax=Aspergillus luchuensis (strain CBS 106.47) TaxID=1137211 RepID=A0A1M3T1L0_ASPLC|nr:hypothetical protein ASPFODRAFT_38029 [Aspergillus luchuensis CBS 106.47]
MAHAAAYTVQTYARIKVSRQVMAASSASGPASLGCCEMAAIYKKVTRSKAEIVRRCSLEDGGKESTAERKKGRRTFWEHLHLSPHVAAARSLWELTKPITNLSYAKIPTFYEEYLRGRLGIPEVVETE